MAALVPPLMFQPSPGFCNAGSTPCGAPAKLFLCGWRCVGHKPGGGVRLVALPEPAEVRAVEPMPGAA